MYRAGCAWMYPVVSICVYMYEERHEHVIAVCFYCKVGMCLLCKADVHVC